MANELTGGFDVVAEFTVPAVNRVLAAMHRGNRFPHSLSVRVDDTQGSRGSLAVTDLAGNAIVSRMAPAPSGNPPLPGSFGLGTAVTAVLTQVRDVVVNFGGVVVVDEVGQLKGVAQLQLGTPTITLPSNSIATGTVHSPVMVRYFPDPNTGVIPEFMHGDIQTTFTATQRSSLAGKVIHVDLAGPGGGIHFQPAPPQNITPSQLKAINLALRNSLATTFQPSNTPLPPSVVNMQFFALPATNAIAVLMNLPGGQPPPGELFSWNSIFLGPQDQFAIAVSADFISASILPQVNATLDPFRDQTVTTRVTVDLFFGSFSFHVFAHITVGAAAIEFQSGKILLNIPVHVNISSDSRFGPSRSFNIMLRQAFTLGLSGGQVSLLLLGNLVVDIPSSILDDIIGAIFGDIKSQIQAQAQTVFTNAWNNANAQIQQQVGGKLSATTLQGFLRKLMNPVTPPQNGTPPPEEVDPTLTYTSFEIRPAGVVLHGALAVPPPPPPHVEFDLVPSTASAPHPEYNALNSWIPGGTVQDYIWSYDGSARPPDFDKFISTGAPKLGFVMPRPICLTVQGTRLTPSGPVVTQAVSLQFCKGLLTNTDSLAPSPGQGGPDIAVTHVTAAGKLEVVGHTSPWAREGTPPNRTANCLFYFPDDQSLAHLDLLTTALRQSGRADAAAMIVCVLTAGQIASVRPADGLAFADDAAAWERHFNVARRPTALLLDTSGKEVYRHAGPLTAAALADALKKHLAGGGAFKPRFQELSLRVGQRAPNIVFEYEPGHQLTLRKLGRAAALVFGKESQQFLDTLGNLHKTFDVLGEQAPVLLAIVSGGTPEAANALAAANRLSAIVVPDPERAITLAYSVTSFPTTLLLDPSGVIKEIRFGRVAEEHLQVQSTDSRPA